MRIIRLIRTCPNCAEKTDSSKHVCAQCNANLQQTKIEIQFNWDALRLKLKALSPKYWISVDVTCKEWDKTLNEYLDNPNAHFEKYDGYRAVINGETLVWIGNYPYGYGNKCEGLTLRGPLPKNSTRIRLYERLKNAPWYNTKNSPKIF